MLLANLSDSNFAAILLSLIPDSTRFTMLKYRLEKAGPQSSATYIRIIEGHREEFTNSSSSVSAHVANTSKAVPPQITAGSLEATIASAVATAVASAFAARSPSEIPSIKKSEIPSTKKRSKFPPPGATPSCRWCHPPADGSPSHWQNDCPKQVNFNKIVAAHAAQGSDGNGPTSDQAYGHFAYAGPFAAISEQAAEANAAVQAYKSRVDDSSLYPVPFQVILDCGATRSMTADGPMLTDLVELDTPITIVGIGGTLPTVAKISGTYTMQVAPDKAGQPAKTVIFPGVLYVPTLSITLISLVQLFRDTTDDCQLHAAKNQLTGELEKIDFNSTLPDGSKYKLKFFEKDGLFVLRPFRGATTTTYSTAAIATVPIPSTPVIALASRIAPLPLSDRIAPIASTSRRSIEEVEEDNSTSNQTCKQPLDPSSDAHHLPDLICIHCRLGHASQTAMRDLLSVGGGGGLEERFRAVIKSSLKLVCGACAKGKGTVTPIDNKKVAGRVTKPLARLHLDLVTLSSPTVSGSKYVLVILDEYERFIEVAFLRKKSDAFEAVQRFITKWENLLDLKVKHVRSDLGGEFTGAKWDAYYASKGIQKEGPPAHSSRQNGLIEKANRTIIEHALAMMADTNLPIKYASYAILEAVRLYNLRPHSALKIGSKIPHVIFNVTNSVKPTKITDTVDLSKSRIFGCLGWVNVEKVSRKKLEDHSTPSIVLGYNPFSKATIILVNGVVKESINVTFDESQRPRPGKDLRSQIGPIIDEFIDEPIESIVEWDDTLSPTMNLEALNLSESLIEISDAQFSPPRTPAPRQVGLNDVERDAGTVIAEATPEHSISLENIQPETPVSTTATPNHFELATPPSQQEASFEIIPETPETIERDLFAPIWDESLPIITGFPSTIGGEDDEAFHAKAFFSTVKNSTFQVPDSIDDPAGLAPATTYILSHPPVHTSYPRVSAFHASPANSAEIFEMDFDSPPLLNSTQTVFSFSAIANFNRTANPDDNETPTFGQIKFMSPEMQEKWDHPMIEEVEALKKNGTGVLVPRPDRKSGISILKVKWVLSVKKDEDGNFLKRKGRLVVLGCSQRYGVNYTSTTATVARQESFRTLCAIAANQSLHIQSFDVKNAYLQGTLDADNLYCEQPKGFAVKGKEDHVWLLKKPLYGLKQAGRCWQNTVKEFFLSLNFRQNPADDCVWRLDEGASFVIIYIHVDDGACFTNDLDLLKNFRINLESRFGCRWEENTTFFLGLNLVVDREAGTVSVSQRTYIESILSDYGLPPTASKATTKAPYHPSSDKKLERATDEEVAEAQHLPFRPLLGAVSYCANISRPDIAATVSIISTHTSRPSIRVYELLKHLLRYLRSTSSLALVYKKSAGLEATYFCDANWGGCATTAKSTTGAVVMLAGAAVIWRTKKQAVVALSTTESEYYSMTELVTMVLWFSPSMDWFGFPQTSPATLRCDNAGAMCLAKDPTTFHRSKHINFKHHFIRDIYNKKIIDWKYIKSCFNVADILTKPLGNLLHQSNTRALGLRFLDFKGDVELRASLA